jgi:hypothetical protein
MPSLKDRSWHYIAGERARDYTRCFGIFHIRYGLDGQRNWNDYMRSCRGIPIPLFQRAVNGNISHPFRNEGWWWNYEAAQVRNNQNCEFAGAWILDDGGERPFQWVKEAYDVRLQLQQAGDPAEKALKWMLASVYGTVAQRAGWDRHGRKAPHWHQLEWAGATTSVCRSLIYSGAAYVASQGGLVSIDTDGIISTVPFGELPNGRGDGLGQWKVEKYSGIIYFQNGIYWLRDMSGNWQPPKTRGIPRGQIGDPEIAVDALRNGGKLTLTRHNFVGYGAAIHRKDRSVWRTWQDVPYEIDINYSGCRQHVRKICRACNQGLSLVEGLHDLAMVPARDESSAPHKLPWLEADDTDTLRERIRHEIEQHEMNGEFI